MNLLAEDHVQKHQFSLVVRVKLYFEGIRVLVACLLERDDGRTGHQARAVHSIEAAKTVKLWLAFYQSPD